MIIFLYGKDGFRLKRKVDEIAAEYRKKYASGINFSVLAMEEKSPEPDFLRSIEDLVKTTTFFNEKRFVIIKNFFSLGDKLASLIKVWNLSADKQRIFVFAENYGKTELSKKNKELFNLLSVEPNLVEVFEPLEGKKLETWVGKEFAARDCAIESEALRKLISFVTPILERGAEPNGDIGWRLNQEIEKLADYKISSGAKTSVTAADVELLVRPSVDLNIFKITDALASKNRALATSSLFDYLRHNDDPHYVFSMFIYQFRSLLKVKSLIRNAVPPASIPKLTGLHPYAARKACQQCAKFDFDELKRLYQRLSQMEIEAKTGKINLTDNLFQFIFSLS